MLEFLQVMGYGRGLHPQFRLDFTGHHALGVRAEQMVDDAQARLGAQGGQGIGELNEVYGRFLAWGQVRSLRFSVNGVFT